MVNYFKYPNSVLVGAAMCVYWNYEEVLKNLGVDLHLGKINDIFSTIGHIVLKNEKEIEKLDDTPKAAVKIIRYAYNQICEFCNRELNNDNTANEVLLRYRNVLHYNHSYTDYHCESGLMYKPDIYYSDNASIVDTALDQAIEKFRKNSIKKENLGANV